MSQLIDTAQTDFTLALGTDSTYTTAPAVPAVSATEPATVDGTTTAVTNLPVIKLGYNYIIIRFLGTGADDTGYTCGVYLGAKTQIAAGASTRTDSSVPTYSFELAILVDAQLSTYVGVAGGIIPAATRYADVLAEITAGPALRKKELFSPGSNLGPGHLVLDTTGYSYCKLIPDIDGHASAATVTTANFEYAFI